MPDRVVVRAPATVANLGPGFDCIGLALDLASELSVERAPDGTLEVAAEGEWMEGVPLDERNLAVQGLRAFLGPAAGLRVHCAMRIPLGRGLGSSAAAIAGGLVAGAALAGRGDEPLLETATALEGHADNVAACLAGGIVVAARGRVVPLGAPEALRVLVCVSPGGLSTAAARRALPEQVPLADAVASVGRAALLAAALATGDRDALLDATDDLLHQPPRFAIMPDSGGLVAELRSRGVAAFLSGAGPSVAALVPAGDAGGAEEAARRAAPEGWRIFISGIAATGAVVVA